MKTKTDAKPPKVGQQFKGGLVLAIRPDALKGWFVVLRLCNPSRDINDFAVHFTDGKELVRGGYYSDVFAAVSNWQAGQGGR